MAPASSPAELLLRVVLLICSSVASFHTTIIADAGSMRSRVIANCAVVNPHDRGSSGAVIANAAAIISRYVAVNNAIIERHCRRTSVMYAAAVAKCRVIGDRAIIKSQRGMIVVDAATIGNGWLLAYCR